MSPEVFFWLSLLLKMVVTAGFVVAVTVVAERTGPLVGGLSRRCRLRPASSMPSLRSTTPRHSYPIQPWEAWRVNAPIAVFALVFALLAQTFGWIISISSALLVWLVLAVVVHMVPWSLTGALALNAVTLGVCLYFARPFREVQVPGHDLHWTDIAARALAVAVVVAAVVELSAHIGPSATGILALFPITMMSVMFILQRRVGGKAAAAVMANSILGLIGLALAFVVVHLTVVPLGAVVGLALGLATSILWSVLVVSAKRYGVPL